MRKATVLIGVVTATLLLPVPTSAQHSITIDPDPVGEIGGVGGGIELYRVTDGLIHSDGTILLANRGTNEILHFRPDGTLLRRVGGEGAGPGEFQRITEVRSGPGGQVYAYDPGLQRLTIFDRELDRVNSIQLTSMGARIGSAGWAGGEDIWILEESRLNPGTPGRVRRDTVRLSRYFPATGGTTELTRIPGLRTATFTINGSQGARFAPFSPRPDVARAGRCFVLSAGDDFAFRSHSPDGRVLDTVRLDFVPREVTGDDIEAYEAEMLRSLPDDAHPLARRLVTRLPFPDRTPAWNDIAVDPSGLVWLERYRPPTGVSGSWLVTTVSGDLIAEARLPEPMKVLDIGRDRLLALRLDELGVETVSVYRIRRVDGGDRLPADCR